MNKYPMPKSDHTVASGNADGSSNVHVPIVSTPSNSAAQHTSAALRAFSHP